MINYYITCCMLQLSDKLLTYDEQAIALGYQRKDKHVFIYLFFVYTLVTISWQSYYDIDSNISKEITGIITILQSIVSNVIGAYCVLMSCIFLDLIRQRYRHLNEMIVPHVSELPVTGLQGEITVYDVRYLHGVLFDCARLINALYGIGTLFTFISILLELISVIYMFIKNMQKNGPASMLNLLFQTIYLFAMYHFTTYEVKTKSFIVISFESIFCVH